MVGYRYDDMVRVNVGVAVQRFYDSMTHVPFESPGRDLDVVHDVANPTDVSYGLFRLDALVRPAHLSAQCKVAILHDELQARRNVASKLQPLSGIPGDFRVRPL